MASSEGAVGPAAGTLPEDRAMSQRETTRRISAWEASAGAVPAAPVRRRRGSAMSSMSAKDWCSLPGRTARQRSRRGASGLASAPWMGTSGRPEKRSMPLHSSWVGIGWGRSEWPSMTGGAADGSAPDSKAAAAAARDAGSRRMDRAWEFQGAAKRGQESTSTGTEGSSPRVMVSQCSGKSHGSSATTPVKAPGRADAACRTVAPPKEWPISEILEGSATSARVWAIISRAVSSLSFCAAMARSAALVESWPPPERRSRAASSPCSRAARRSRTTERPYGERFAAAPLPLPAPLPAAATRSVAAWAAARAGTLDEAGALLAGGTGVASAPISSASTGLMSWGRTIPAVGAAALRAEDLAAGKARPARALRLSRLGRLLEAASLARRRSLADAPLRDDAPPEAPPRLTPPPAVGSASGSARASTKSTAVSTSRTRTCS
mmetsp:Transcript_14312/g.54198  ORF Transcript_14312/g.54198 Transcript_14312/m.54198 type:complete len:437 (-) Transcript_14312:925-2235(-)